MAEQQASGSGVDPISGFWRDVWARWSTTGAPGAGMAGMPGGMGDPSTFFSPDAVRRMQAAFYDAMAQYAEQYMRSPDFLAAMRRSMDQAMQFRSQMDDFLKSNMASAFETATGGANSEILGAIRHSGSQIQAQIAKLEERVAAVESLVGDEAPKAKPTAKAASKPIKAKSTK
jgi:hypothetical protein